MYSWKNDPGAVRSSVGWDSGRLEGWGQRVRSWGRIHSEPGDQKADMVRLVAGTQK